MAAPIVLVPGFWLGASKWIAALAELRDVTRVELPTSHWPLWSRLQELAAAIGEVARRGSTH
jgi:triacylglycerol esterase/lipase EstA (alpha/beta hydrolase family)